MAGLIRGFKGVDEVDRVSQKAVFQDCLEHRLAFCQGGKLGHAQVLRLVSFELDLGARDATGLEAVLVDVHAAKDGEDVFAAVGGFFGRSPLFFFSFLLVLGFCRLAFLRLAVGLFGISRALQLELGEDVPFATRGHDCKGLGKRRLERQVQGAASVCPAKFCLGC